jgi:hypothetical protein
MLVERVLDPASKLATARALADSTLGSELAVEGVDEDDLYRALDWLSERQGAIERRQARRHLREGEHAPYDVSSSYFEGRSPARPARLLARSPTRLAAARLRPALRPPRPPALLGGLPRRPARRPDAARQPARGARALRAEAARPDRRPGHGHRGANLEAIGQAGFAFISALRAPQVKRLVKRGELQLSLFEEQGLAEIESAELVIPVPLIKS